VCIFLNKKENKYVSTDSLKKQTRFLKQGAAQFFLKKAPPQSCFQLDEAKGII
jgi:hypothetical protein